MVLTARTLTLDLLSTLHTGAMPVRALVEAGELFGFAANNVRVSLSKLYAEGRVSRDDRGHYRLSQVTKQLSTELRRWRKLEEQQHPWPGDWLAIHCPRLGRGSPRRRRERALAVLGFRPLEAGLYLRPDNLTGGVETVRSRFFSIASLDAEDAANPLVYGVRELDSAADLRARGLWNAEDLTRSYRRRAKELEASRSRLPRLSEPDAMVESFLVGANVVRELMLDPLLPSPILDPAPRRALVEAMLEYDELGRGYWAPFLLRHGVHQQLRRGSPEGWRTAHGALQDAAIQGVET
jgi:phenylacetic acid degradation operon negative regulatory protein